MGKGARETDSEDKTLAVQPRGLEYRFPAPIEKPSGYGVPPVIPALRRQRQEVPRGSWRVGKLWVQ